MGEGDQQRIRGKGGETVEKVVTSGVCDAMRDL